MIRGAAALSAEFLRRLEFCACGGRRACAGARCARPRRLEAHAVGSVRRGAATAGDLDFLVVARAPAPAWAPGGVLAAARLAPPAPGDRLRLGATYAQGLRRRSLVLRAGRREARADLFLATPAERPFALFHYTGPASYNVRTRAKAKGLGLRLSQYGLFDAATGRPRGAGLRTEAALAARLGLAARPPAERK